jgi:DNA-binding IclR family transcriptional regulator
MSFTPEENTPITATDDRVQRPSVVERVTQILDAFQQSPDRLLLEDVTAITSLPRSTAFRLMTQLVELGWLDHDAHGYRLGARAIGMSARTHDHGGLRSMAARMLNRLHLQTRAVVHLAVLEGGLLYYLDKVGGPVLDSIPSTVGTRVPADTTPMGRAMLATLSPERVDALVASTADHPRRAPLDLMDLHRRLGACRQRGGVDIVRNGGAHQRINALGAPVHGPDGLLASIGVSCGDGQLVPEHVAPLLLSAARHLTTDLGGTVGGRNLRLADSETA